ncbi:MAG: hypothetical protein ABI423_00330 [Burkholderiales bacterium]
MAPLDACVDRRLSCGRIYFTREDALLEPGEMSGRWKIAVNTPQR